MTDSSATKLKALGAALNAKDRAAVVSLSRDLIEDSAPLGANWKSISTALLHSGELALSRRAADLYLSGAPNIPAARFDVAALSAQRGDLAAALDMLDRPGVAWPDASAVAYLRGTIALNQGAFADAAAHLLDALAAAPRSGQIALALSQTGPMRQDSDAAAAIVDGATHMVASDPLQRAQQLYALGKVHDDRQDHSAAFAAFAGGAAIMARLRPYNADRDAAGAAIATAGYTTERIAAIAHGITIPTDDAIVVTGSPRSGSTLVEQILVSHSAVADGAELGLFRHIIGEVRGVSVAALEAFCDQQDPSQLAQLYLRLARERFGSGRFVDKSLDASRYLGLLAAVLPDAPIIWMRRDPLDCAWSCFRTFLLRGADWSWSLDSIARHFKHEDELLKNWRTILGTQLLEVDYAALVTAPTEVIPGILSRCGLQPEAGVMTPERTQRAVTTSSVAQVRRPINSASIGSADPYRQWLQPFLSAYRPG